MDTIGKGGSLSAGAHAVDSMAQMAAYATARGENYKAQQYTIAMVPARHGIWYVIWEVARHAIRLCDGSTGYQIRKREVARHPFLQEAEEHVNLLRSGRMSFSFAGRFFKTKPIAKEATVTCP